MNVYIINTKKIKNKNKPASAVEAFSIRRGLSYFLYHYILYRYVYVYYIPITYARNGTRSIVAAANFARLKIIDLSVILLCFAVNHTYNTRVS